MNDVQFNKIFEYLQKLDNRLQYVEENMATKASIDHLINTMDDSIRRITDNDDENAARDAQFSRLVE